MPPANIAENLALVRRMQEAFLGSEPDLALGFFAPDVEWDVSERPGGKVWHGPSGVRQAMLEWTDVWEDWQIETERYVAVGSEQVLILWRERGRGTGSGLPTEQRGGSLITVREGRIVRGHLYTDQAAALRAVGLAPSG